SISLHATADELAAHARLLLDIRAEVVVDHLAYLNPGDLDGEGFRFLREAVTREVMAALPGLQVISKIGVGVDTVDVAAASNLGIAVCNTPGGNDSVAVAEHAMTLLLALRKQLHVWTRGYLQGGGWRSPQVFAGGLDGSTLGIVGFGRIGRALAQRVAGWNVRVLVHDPLARDLPAGVQAVGMDELLAQSDAVSLHCPALPGDPCLNVGYGLVVELHLDVQFN
ncbi:MAG: NAD(P)-dependent oxidoreductase, partial [Hydrogenophaga sp.]